MGAESPPEYLCGVSILIANQRKLLEERGWTVYQVHPYYPSQPNDPYVKRVFSVPLPKSQGYRIALLPSLDPITNMRLVKWLEGIKPDVVHLHGPHQVTSHLLKAARALRIPTVLQLHTDDLCYIDNRLPQSLTRIKKFLKWFQIRRTRRITKQVGNILCPSKNYQQRFRANFSYDGPMTILPSAIEPVERIGTEVRARFSLSFRNQNLAINDQLFPLLVYAGRISPEKNCSFVLDVMAELDVLLEIHPIKGIKLPVLAFIGTGPIDYMKRLRQRADKLGLGNQIYFAGERPHDETLKIMQIATFCLLPSKSETQGLVGIEAQLCGCLPIVLEDTALAEFVPDDELILPESADIWAKVILTLLSNENKRAEKAETNRLQSLQYCDSEKYISSLLRIYPQV